MQAITDFAGRVVNVDYRCSTLTVRYEGLSPVVGAEVALVSDGERDNPSMPQSNKERQEALRARRAMLGMTEVRGIYLPPEQHAELKAFAKKLQKRKKPIDKAQQVE